MSWTTGGAQFDNEDTSLTRRIDMLLRNTVSPADRPWLEELAGIQAEINKLHAAPAVLQQKQDGPKKLLPCRSLLPPPVHRLPPEILGNIFGTLIATEKGWLKSENHPALAVSWTCGRWRDIAVSTPSIWSSIMIHFEDQGKHSNSQLHSLTQLFLDRSRRCPLELVLNFCNLVSGGGSDEWDDVVPILKTLVQHCERWRTVELRHIEREMGMHEVFNPVVGHLPILRDLTIFGAGSWGELSEDDDFHNDLFSDSPALTSISYQPFGPLTPQNRLPWKQIRSIRIKDAFYNEVIWVVPLWTNVEQLTFKDCGEPGEEFVTYTGDRLAIPSVTHFSVAARLNCELNFPFQNLTLQRLSSLEISSSGRPVRYSEQYVANFFSRSACTVTSLSLKCIHITDEELIRFLQLMPMLKLLQLEEKLDDEAPPDVLQSRAITKQFLRKLTIDEPHESTLFLPKLTDIGLTLYDHGLAERALPTALLSRWILNGGDGSKQRVDCIKSIDIVFIGRNKEPVEILKEKLQPLRDTGVWMSLRVAPRGS